MKYIEPRCGSF